MNRTFNDAGQLLVESFSGGPLNGLSVTNGYDQYLRRTNLNLLSSSSQLLSSTKYTYDDASRLDMVSDGTNSATYSYLANSPLVEQITFATNGTTVMTTTKGYDALNRLTNITTLDAGLATLDSHAYAYNSANQRTSITNADNTRWVYQYDSLGQVISGKKYWSDGTPVAGQQFEYGFDDIGNRKSTKAGGDNSGANLWSANYTANNLNQYTSRDVPGYVNMLGSANSNATITLWSGNELWARALRKGDYFSGELPINNTTGAVWLTITNLAVLNDGGNPDIVTNIAGNVLLARTPETFTYDFDGNLTSDGLWTNQWNGENRRTTISSGAGVSPAARVQEQWMHLPDGRWIERVVSTWNGSAYVATSTNRYIWDGQVLLAVLNHTNGIELSFMRGLDLSGTMQGAGGVGGLLWVQDQSTINPQPSTHFVANDGNGNVTALVNDADGNLSARYEYGPFGEPIRMTGPMAKANPIRFSSQYADDHTLDCKYLHRDLDGDKGRWKSRDRISERRFRNLYCFVANAPTHKIDRIGRETQDFGYATYTEVFNVPMDDSDTLAYTTQARLLSPPPRQSCGFCGTRFKYPDNYFHYDGTIAYAAGVDPERANPRPPPSTIRGHELVHAENSSDYLEGCSKAFLLVEPFKCVSSDCFKAKRRYLDNFFYYSWWVLNAKNAKFDCEQYDDPESCLEYPADEAAATTALQQTRDAAGAMNSACSGQFTPSRPSR